MVPLNLTLSALSATFLLKTILELILLFETGIEEHQRDHAATCKPEYVALTTFGLETKIQVEFTTNLDTVRQKLGRHKWYRLN